MTSYSATCNCLKTQHSISNVAQNLTTWCDVSQRSEMSENWIKLIFMFLGTRGPRLFVWKDQFWTNEGSRDHTQWYNVSLCFSWKLFCNNIYWYWSLISVLLYFKYIYNIELPKIPVVLQPRTQALFFCYRFLILVIRYDRKDIEEHLQVRETKLF